MSRSQLARKLESEYEKGFREGRKTQNQKFRMAGRADVLEYLPNVKGIGPKLHRRIIDNFKNQKDFEAVPFSIPVRKNEYKKFFHIGGEIIWNQKKHVITRIDRIQFKDYEIQISGMCVLRD